MGDEVEDHVVRLVSTGEVLAAVIDHLVRSDRVHQIQLPRVVDAGHVRTAPLRQLDRERARASTRSVDQNPPARSGSRCPLQRDRAGLRDCRCLHEGQLARLQRERRLGCNRVLGEATHQRQIVAIDLVTPPEASDAGAHRLDPTRDVRAERAVRG
jgi:hypothetical protein